MKPYSRSAKERINKMIDKIKKTGIIPVVKIDDAAKALNIADALFAGGIDIVEITFRTDCAAEAIKIIKQNRPEMTIGAGTVLTSEQVESAKNAGADFIVSPGFNKKTAEACREYGLFYLPGAITPTEIEAALESDIKTVKFFPAEAAGGIKMIKALAAPYSFLTFVPTGGVDLSNIADYLSFSKVAAVGGSFMVGENLIKENRYEEITKISAETVDLIAKLRSGQK